MAKDLKSLPPGQFFYIGGLPVDTTDEQISVFLQERGLVISPDCVSARNNLANTAGQCVVSVPKEVVLDMFAWVVNGDTFGGRPFRPEFLSKQPNPRRAV